MARKNEKENDKEVIEEAGKKTAPEIKKETGKEVVRVRFKNTYIGTCGIFYAGKEYGLDDGLYNLFKDEVEALG